MNNEITYLYLDIPCRVQRRTAAQAPILLPNRPPPQSNNFPGELDTAPTIHHSLAAPHPTNPTSLCLKVTAFLCLMVLPF